MMLMVMATLAVGACAFTLALWFTGYRGLDERASSRLTRLRGGEDGTMSPSAEPGKPRVARRRRAVVQFGNISLVPADMAAKWNEELTRAGLALHVKEYFLLRLFVALLGIAFAMMIAPMPAIRFPLAAAGAAGGFFVPALIVKQRISRRRRRIESQVLELLPLVASGLRSGFGLVQALTTASDQMEGPLKVELDRMLRDIAVGSSVEAAFEALRERIGSPDFDIVVMAILIQRSVGGNLANILDGVAETMRERDRIKGEISALTAQQRMTGFVIGGLPVAMFALFWVLNPEFERLLITEPLGRAMLGGAILAEVLGFLVILKIIKIEV